jgi:signal transduction histidine kinase
MLGYQDAAQLNQSVGSLAEELQVRRVDTGAPVSGEDQAFSQALAGKPDIQEVLIRNRRTGEDRVIRSACAPIRVGGQVVGAVAINTDITENKRAERLLRERADFEKQLIGIVSHDLRNPLSAILLGATSLLRRDELDERTITVAARMRSSAERAARMVRDLLDFTQARLGGGIPVEPKPANLHEVAREVLEEVEATHPGRELRVQSEGDGRGEWDPDRLAQVVQNLVTNALTYSPAKTPVQVATRGEEGAVTLSVHNQGTPIPPERLSQLFEPFHRGEETVDRTSRNVGLGLYIVKQLVAAHGGSIRAHSSEAEGTTFVVRLPRRRAGRDR